MTDASSSARPPVEDIVRNVRSLASSIPEGVGPSDDLVFAAVGGFVQAFNFRYSDVIRKTVPKYRPNIVARVNPLIRRFQLEGLSAKDVADRLVEDWAARNFVTAGGFAIEELAIGVSVDAQKSATSGIDIQRFDPASAVFHLYVLKSGLVTRNSDILAALKTNSRKAERVLRAGHTVNGVTSNYAIAAGKTSPTSFEDGVRRPSSDDFWSEMTGLSPDLAVELVLAIAAEAGRLVRSDAAEPLAALKLLVGVYIQSDSAPGTADWQWIARRTMRPKPQWVAEDKRRHALAIAALKAAGLAAEAEAAAAVAVSDDEEAEDGLDSSSDIDSQES